MTSKAVATMYGADVTARLALARARWLVAAASTSAEWKSGFVDPITGAALEKVPGESTYPIDSNKEGAGRDDTRASALTAAEMILRDVLTAVEGDVIALAEAEHARIAEANAKLEAMLANMTCGWLLRLRQSLWRKKLQRQRQLQQVLRN